MIAAGALLGDFEAEIDPADVKSLTADIRKALPELPQEATPTPLGTSAAVEAGRQLSLSDPVMALAEVRIELERTLRRLLLGLDMQHRLG
jgi:hypothetical protein